ncbi:MAG: hypothetical protein AB8C84_00710 [Oligoflexales bacterium]
MDKILACVVCYVLFGVVYGNDLNLLMVERYGENPDAYMKTERILKWLQPQVSYQIPSMEKDEKQNVVMSALCSSQKPPMLKVEAQWNKEESIQREDASILGGFGTLIVDNEKDFCIPVAPSQKSFFAYYGAYLIPYDNVVQFESDSPLPLTEMRIGPLYAEQYLMDEQLGGGFYLETHDRPHFHMPLNVEASGYLILGKMNGRYLEVSAFSIPYGYSVYTPPEVIHNDGFLVGHYKVVYSVTEHYSTVLLQNQTGQMLPVSIEK